MDGRRQGRPEEEMFLSKPSSEEVESPTIGPLRINKAGTASPESARPGGAYGMPPNAPLPYPDDRGRHGSGSGSQIYTPPSESGSGRSRTGTPTDGRGKPQGTAAPAPLSGTRTKFSANDPHKPSAVTGYGYAPYPTHDDSKRPKPLPDSPGPDTQDKDDALFQKPMQRPPKQDDPRRPSAPAGAVNPFPEYHQQYWPPTESNASKAPTAPNAGGGLTIPNPVGVSRLSSTASTSTTRAQRGSPPPPETPVDAPPGAGGIEARYAAAGIAGTGTLSNMQSAAAAQRAAHYPAPYQRPSPAQQGGQPPPQRPWTPTETPGTAGTPPVVYQGMNEVASGGTGPPGRGTPTGMPPSASPQTMPPSRQAHVAGQEAQLEHDMHRLNVNEDAPPAYSSLHPGPGQTQGYPNEKGQFPQAAGAGAVAGAAAGAATMAVPQQAFQAVPGQQGLPQGHPAFANQPQPLGGAVQQQQQQQQQILTPQPMHGQAGPSKFSNPVQIQLQSASPAPSHVPASPPPLPEGWIAHLDPNTGQYYYIHMPTQSTQWEFPKGPTPLSLNEPLSPTGTIFNPGISSPIASSFSKPPLTPGMPIQQHATFRPDSVMTMTALQTPTAAGFTGPPPSAGLDVYKVQPSNGVYFGPHLRYTNMDIENGVWLGSIMIITEAPQPPTIHIHQSMDLSPNPRQLKAQPIYSHQRWMFYRYDMDLRMDEMESTKWTYAVTSHLGCTRYEFVVAGRHETSWRFIAHSGNDFGLSVSQNERSRLGGIGVMWKDILQKHIECNGFHAQLGLGNQIFADRIWKDLPLLRQWTATSGKENRKNAQWTARHEEDATHAYFHYYTSHFDQPHLREAFAQIPHVLGLDDHDIFDGFGSYPEHMQFSNMFKNIGRIGIEMYLLFQHHTTLEILRNVSNDMDLFTITGTGWHFVKFLGPAVVVVGPDCRSERNPHQVMAGPTWQGLFPKVATLPPSVQHCIWMIPVPVVYPRMENVESLANTVATGKKAVTGTFNMLGRVAGGVAGVVGAKQVVGDGFNSVKKAVGKSGLMSGVLSPFGDIDMLDELRDLWTHESKDLERTYFIRTIQGVSHNKSIRMTIFSGSVSCCGVGMLHDPSHPLDHKTMYQVIASAVVDAPPSGYVLRLLNNNKALYVPANGHRSTNAPSDTKEDMMEIFAQDVNGQPREAKRLMGRRNYAICVAFDPEIVQGAFGKTVGGAPGTGHVNGSGRLSLAVDFLVQGDGQGGYGIPKKYGPIVIPHLEYAR